jgi:hypothetical protein
MLQIRVAAAAAAYFSSRRRRVGHNVVLVEDERGVVGWVVGGMGAIGGGV